MRRETRCPTCDGYGYTTSHPVDGSVQQPCPAGCDGGWIR